ncbi:MAG: sporulation protein, partial [Lachnospiraceae bacterium]|nr:sporulation protein [Lachnospiraceae bacterium]
IIPALFPFLVLSSLVVELGMSRYLGRLLEPVMFPLFRVNGTCATALALGFLGGYPVGAQTALRLYQSSQCSRTETDHCS